MTKESLANQEQERQFKHQQTTQSLQIEAMRASLEWEKAQIDVARERVTLEREQVALQRELLELDQQRKLAVLENTSYIVDVLQPGLDSKTKNILSETLLPEVLQLTEGKELEIKSSLVEQNNTTEVEEDSEDKSEDEDDN